MDHRMWYAQTAALAPDYRVVRYDMLGHGGAPDPLGRRSLADFVEQAHEVVRTFSDQGPPVLVGFSMGGLIAQAYGIRNSSTLRGLVLLNAVYDRSEAERSAVLDRLAMMRDDGVESVVEAAAERWFSRYEQREMGSAIEEIFAWMRSGEFGPKVKAYEVFAAADAEVAGQLDAIGTPTLVMTGEGDAGSPPRMARDMAGAIAGAHLLILDDQRHMMPVLDATRVNLALVEFFASL
jgi:pimeloyl-ACP methyl ester carboxylesterase